MDAPRLTPAALAALAALALLTAAAPARAEGADKEKAADKADTPEVSGSHYPPFSTRFKVLATGVAITGVAWGITYAASRGWPEQACTVLYNSVAVYPGTTTLCSSGPPGASQLGIPIVGPWIALGKSGCASDEPNCSVAKPALRGVAYVVDGVVQLAGIGLIVEALVMKTESTADPSGKSSALSFRYRGVEMTPLPMVTPSMSGIGVMGTF